MAEPAFKADDTTQNRPNPMSTDGFAFIEFTDTDNHLEQLFEAMGLVKIATHKDKAINLYRQNNITFLLNLSGEGQAGEFAKIHGPSVSAMGWQVKDSELAREYATEHGATAVETGTSVHLPAIEGIGGSLIYLVDDMSQLESSFNFLPGNETHPKGAGLMEIDHLTNNVKRGNMAPLAEFYENIAGFFEVRRFDIEGKKSGLLSKAMTAPCGKIRIPINETKGDGTDVTIDQTAKFIHEYNGEGIQHIALSTDDIYATVDALRNGGIKFQSTPDTYYEKVDTRVPNHGENLEELHSRKILIDGDEQSGILLQIFTQDNIGLGPVFFEIIQRKGNQGFGEGNFKALFESIEEENMRKAQG